MSAVREQIRTDSYTGRREYWIEEIARPRWMRSLTTIQKAAANESLIYAAGRLGMEATSALAHELAQHGDDPADFGFRLERLCAERFGRAKRAPFAIKPPHVAAWAGKADDGKAVHNDIERGIKLRLGVPALVPFDLSKFPDERKARVAVALASWQTWQTWQAQTDFVPLASESVVYMEGWEDADWNPANIDPGWPRFDFAARIDLLCMIGGVRAVLDIKTGKMGRSGPYENQWMQVECQRRAVNARGLCGGNVGLAGILHVPAAGGPVVCYLNDQRDQDADFAAFDLLNGFSRWMFGPVGEGE